MHREREALKEGIRAFIASCGTSAADRRERDRWIDTLCAWQRQHVAAYARWVEVRGPGDAMWPTALPTEVFRWARVAAHDESEDRRVFWTSGTTAAERGVHPFRELDLYDLAAHRAAKQMLFGDDRPLHLIVLAPDEGAAPHSSLSYMLSRFAEWFACRSTWLWGEAGLDLEALARSLDQAQRQNEPVGLLGTSFAFVHALDALPGSYRLPEGSRIMQTGGFKGRSREIEAPQMRAWLAERFGLPLAAVAAEYGMTEMSSQLYELNLFHRDAAEQNFETPEDRVYLVPPWVRATPVDPDTLQPLAEGERGLLRIDDLANLDSACALQTADLAEALPGGRIRILGRAPQASPRGCSLAADDLLREQFAPSQANPSVKDGS